MAEVVSTSLIDSIAVVRVDRPPVNAIDRTVRAGLNRAFGDLHKQQQVKAIILACDGRTFMAGADIKEFETGIAEPSYHEVFRLIEDSPVPVIAAIHGTALGAGTEIALACHYRVADEKASIGLPELSLGIIPGAGGTQRLPRVIPLQAAAEMMLSGRPQPATRAKELGLVDEVTKGDLIEAAVGYAGKLIAAGAKPRPTRNRAVLDGNAALDFLEAKRQELAKSMPNRQSPVKLIEVLQTTFDKPFDEGLAIEKSTAAALEQTTESRAMRHLFFAEREVRKIPGLSKAVAARPVNNIGVLGAGTMGSGIAMAFANAGLPVTLVDSKPAALDRARDTIRKNYQRSLSRGSLTADQIETRTKLIGYATELGALSGSDLIVEAVFEMMDLKKQIFGELDTVAKPGVILATNTSTLDIDAIAAATNRPQDVVGLHFFQPGQRDAAPRNRPDQDHGGRRAEDRARYGGENPQDRGGGAKSVTGSSATA